MEAFATRLAFIRYTIRLVFTSIARSLVISSPMPLVRPWSLC